MINWIHFDNPHQGRGDGLVSLISCSFPVHPLTLSPPTCGQTGPLPPPFHPVLSFSWHVSMETRGGDREDTQKERGEGENDRGERERERELDIV